jgi:hypothetical protein
MTQKLTALELAISKRLFGRVASLDLGASFEESF